jgi:hypothetical protein
MSARRRDDEELDLATVARDDATLDALGRGEAVAGGDLLTEMLTAWRADVAVDAADARTTTVLADATNPGRGNAEVPAGIPLPAAGSGRPRPLRRRVWRMTAAVIAALVLATGLGVGSRNAGPASPLWSLTKVLYPERADVSSVEYTIARARDAAAAGRFDEARQLIEQAQRELARVSDPADAARLRAEIDAVLRDLAVPACPTWPRCGTTAVSPTRSPASTAGSTHPSRPATGATGPAQQTTTSARPPAAPAPSPSARPLPLPSLPDLPPPPLPSPSLLPSLLPGLPLPTGGLLG